MNNNNEIEKERELLRLYYKYLPYHIYPHKKNIQKYIKFLGLKTEDKEKNKEIKPPFKPLPINPQYIKDISDLHENSFHFFDEQRIIEQRERNSTEDFPIIDFPFDKKQQTNENNDDKDDKEVKKKEEENELKNKENEKLMPFFRSDYFDSVMKSTPRLKKETLMAERILANRLTGKTAFHSNKCDHKKSILEDRIVFKEKFKDKKNCVIIPFCPLCWVSFDACICHNWKYFTTLNDYYPHFFPKTQKIDTDELNNEKNELKNENNENKENNEKFELEFILYMHCREFYRSSNTAKILLSCYPNTRLIIAGLESHEKRLQKEILESKKNGELFVVLFPSQNSINFDTLFTQICKKNDTNNTNNDNNDNKKEEKEEKEGENDKINENKNKNVHWGNKLLKNGIKKIKILILDGTWGQCGNLNNKIDKSIPRCLLKMENVKEYIPIFNGLRKQTVPGRISTLEAVLFAIKEFHSLKICACENQSKCKKRSCKHEVKILKDNLQDMVNILRGLARLSNTKHKYVKGDGKIEI